MRILVVAPQFFPVVGGYERQLLLLGQEWVRTGHMVDVLTESRAETHQREQLCGIDVFRHRVIRKRFVHRMTSAVTRAMSLACLSFDAAVVGAPLDLLSLSLLVRRAAIARVPLLWRFASTEPHTTADPRRHTRSLRKWLAYPRAGFVTMTSAMRDDLSAGVGKAIDRIFVIPNGVRLPARRTAEPCSRTNMRILSVGRLSKEKDPLLTARVAASLRDLGLPFELTMVGTGPLESALRAFIGQHQLDSLVSVVKDSDAAPRYATADLLLQTSIHEGMSNVLLEAMAAGVPFVTTATRGPRDILTGSREVEPGILLETRRPDEIARVIQALAADREGLGRRGEEGRRLVESRYSIEGAAQGYLDAFARLAGIGSPSLRPTK